MTEGGESLGGGRDGSLYSKLIGCKPCYSSFPINITPLPKPFATTANGILFGGHNQLKGSKCY